MHTQTHTGLAIATCPVNKPGTPNKPGLGYVKTGQVCSGQVGAKAWGKTGVSGTSRVLPMQQQRTPPPSKQVHHPEPSEVS